MIGESVKHLCENPKNLHVHCVGATIQVYISPPPPRGGPYRNGQKTSGLPCDEGYWVNIEALLDFDYLFGESRRNVHPSDRPGRRHDRLRTLIKVNHREREWKKRIRFEVLALTAKIKILRENPEFIQRHGIDVQYIRRQYGNAVEELAEMDRIWLKPIAIRPDVH